MNYIQNGGTAAILDLLKSLISPARFDRFLPNFAGRRIEAIDMFSMSLTFELDPIFVLNLTLRPNPELGRKVGFLPGNRMDLTPLCSELGRKVHFYQMW